VYNSFYYVYDPQLPDNADRYCFAAAGIAASYADAIRDALEVADLAEDLLVGIVEALFESIPVVGEIAEYIDELTEAVQDWAATNFQDEDAVATAKCIIFCAVTKSDGLEGISWIDMLYALGEQAIIDVSDSFQDIISAAYNILDASLLGYAIALVWWADYNLRHKRTVNVMTKIANQAEFFDERDCSGCGCAETSPYEGGVRFTGGFSGLQEQGTVYVDSVSQQGRVIVIAWDKPYGNRQQNDKDLYIEMVYDIPVSRLALKITKVDGYLMPCDVQGVLGTPCPLSQWTRPATYPWSFSGRNYENHTDDYTLDSYPPTQSPAITAGTKSFVWRGIRQDLWETNTAAQTFKFRIEIVNVNGETFGD